MRAAALLSLLLLAGCASLNGRGLIGAGGGASSGSYEVHEPGQPPRTVGAGR